jgi:hypothetical protein
MVRMPPGELAALDNWIERQKNAPSRPRAIRRLVEQALASASPARRDKEAAAKAAEMAEQEIERIEDKAATVEERTRRKRRLIEGPREFREMRSDRPARKTTK